MLAASLLVADLLFLTVWARLVVSTALSIVWYARRRLPQRDPDGVKSGNANVSLVVPAYNEECNIAATLTSLFSLTPPAQEIIVVDDGSTDLTASIADKMLRLHPGGRLLRLPVNRG